MLHYYGPVALAQLRFNVKFSNLSGLVNSFYKSFYTCCDNCNDNKHPNSRGGQHNSYYEQGPAARAHGFFRVRAQTCYGQYSVAKC